MRQREKRHNKRPFVYVTLAAALKKAVSRPTIKRYLNAAHIIEEWEAIAGPDIAQHVQPVSLEKGTLTLRADSSVWKQEIRFTKEQLLDRIDDKFSQLEVRELRVK